MTWHRADGAHPMHAGAGQTDAAPDPASMPRSRPVALGPLRALVAGASAVTLAAVIAMVLLLLGTVVTMIVIEELTASSDADLLGRGAMASFFVLAAIGAVGEPLRRFLGRELLLRATLREPAGQPAPPAAERKELQAGPQGPVLAIAILAISVGGLALLILLLMLADDEPGELLLASAIAAAVLGGGILLASANRRGGPLRERWRRRAGEAAGRWAIGAPTTLREHRQRRHRVLGVAASATGIGALVFFVGVFMRQPGRYADERTYDDAGELAIDGLLLTGAVVMGVAVAVILAIEVGLLLWSAVGEGRAVRALERGERAPLDRIDAILVDDGPLERVAMGLGVIGWIVAVYGWAPGFIAGIEGEEQTQGVQVFAALALPGIAAVAVAWLLGTAGALRRRARRARVHAMLARDPLPQEQPARGRSGFDGTGTFVSHGFGDSGPDGGSGSDGGSGGGD